jgi:hypothetical protein
MIRQVLSAAALLLAANMAALAETPEERQACTDDAFRLCDKYIPDKDRVFACLVQNNQSISALCRHALAPYLPAEPTPVAKQAKTKTGSKTTGKGPLNLNPSAR